MEITKILQGFFSFLRLRVYNNMARSEAVVSKQHRDSVSDTNDKILSVMHKPLEGPKVNPARESTAGT
jgi:hypothetical protein